MTTKMEPLDASPCNAQTAFIIDKSSLSAAAGHSSGPRAFFKATGGWGNNRKSTTASGSGPCHLSVLVTSHAPPGTNHSTANASGAATPSDEKDGLPLRRTNLSTYSPVLSQPPRSPAAGTITSTSFQGDVYVASQMLSRMERLAGAHRVPQRVRGGYQETIVVMALPRDVPHVIGQLVPTRSGGDAGEGLLGRWLRELCEIEDGPEGLVQCSAMALVKETGVVDLLSQYRECMEELSMVKGRRLALKKATILNKKDAEALTATLSHSVSPLHDQPPPLPPSPFPPSPSCLSIPSPRTASESASQCTTLSPSRLHCAHFIFRLSFLSVRPNSRGVKGQLTVCVVMLAADEVEGGGGWGATRDQQKFLRDSISNLYQMLMQLRSSTDAGPDESFRRRSSLTSLLFDALQKDCHLHLCVHLPSSIPAPLYTQTLKPAIRLVSSCQNVRVQPMPRPAIVDLSFNGHGHGRVGNTLEEENRRRDEMEFMKVTFQAMMKMSNGQREALMSCKRCVVDVLKCVGEDGGVTSVEEVGDVRGKVARALERIGEWRKRAMRVEEVSMQSEELMQRLAAAHGRGDRLEEKNQGLLEVLSARDTEVSELKGKVEKYESLLHEVSQETSAARQQIGDLTSQLEEAEGQLTSFQAITHKLEAAKVRADEQKAADRHLLAQREKQLKALEGDLNRALEELEESRTAAAFWEMQLVSQYPPNTLPYGAPSLASHHRHTTSSSGTSLRAARNTKKPSTQLQAKAPQPSSTKKPPRQPQPPQQPPAFSAFRDHGTPSSNASSSIHLLESIDCDSPPSFRLPPQRDDRSGEREGGGVVGGLDPLRPWQHNTRGRGEAGKKSWMQRNSPSSLKPIPEPLRRSGGLSPNLASPSPDGMHADEVVLMDDLLPSSSTMISVTPPPRRQSQTLSGSASRPLLPPQRSTPPHERLTNVTNTPNLRQESSPFQPSPLNPFVGRLTKEGVNEEGAENLKGLIGAALQSVMTDEEETTTEEHGPAEQPAIMAD
ncbi:unnamed protein product [Vitrella brassicaformis CCMP3155]|uniref:Kinesin motor domain-containing protein n=2 Tax=Vitrella brassicaformis TaxID=1169539 RepID=A0A0G4F331_VITBC|nr:unnamed protein product [Vitrella brassicaformis CCMP3155]|eukprot:CEM05806.1 unnamed protein product [Vitrella brassicaformis CCMP3155]